MLLSYDNINMLLESFWIEEIDVPSPLLAKTCSISYGFFMSLSEISPHS